MVASTSSGLKKNDDQREKPLRHWTSVSNGKTTTDGNAAESCNIDRKPPDGILLIVPVVIQGKIFKALIDSGATRCFVSPSCMTVAGLQGKRSDTFLVLANGQRVLSRGYVPNVSVTLSGHTSPVDLTVTNLLHNVDVVLGMTWLQTVRPVIDWVSGEIYIPNSVSTSLVHGEWLQAAVKAGTIQVLSSNEQLQEFSNEHVQKGLSIIRTPQFWQRKNDETQRLWTISSTKESSYCTILGDIKNDD